MNAAMYDKLIKEITENDIPPNYSADDGEEYFELFFEKKCGKIITNISEFCLE